MAPIAANEVRSSGWDCVQAPRKRFTILALILVMAFLVRVIAAWVWQMQADRENTLFRFGDSESYWVLAECIASGRPYEYFSDASKAFRAPAYPVMLSCVAWIQPQQTAIFMARILGAILGTACVAMIYCAAVWIASRWAFPLQSDAPNNRDRTQIPSACYWAGLFAAALASSYLGAIGMSIFILSEAIFCPLMLGTLVLLWLAFDRIRNESNGSTIATRWLLLLSGLLSGLAILARPSWLLWPGVVLLYSLLLTKPCAEARTTWSNRLRQSFHVGLLFGLGVIIAMAPWWYRNYQVFGVFVPTTLQVGASLYDSFHPGATGGSDEGMTFSGDFAKELAKEREARKNGEAAPTLEDELPFEYALDRRLKNSAIAWLKANPSAAAYLALLKFERTWNPMPQASQLGGRSIKVIEAIGYVAILALGGIGLMVSRPWQSASAVFAMPCVYFAVIHSVFVGSVRYRQPAILALCVLAGIGTAWIVVRWKHKTSQKIEST